MGTYRVYCTKTERYFIDVKANSTDEAYEIAEDADFDDFKADDEYNEMQAIYGAIYGRELYDAELID